MNARTLTVSLAVMGLWACGKEAPPPSGAQTATTSGAAKAPAKATERAPTAGDDVAKAAPSRATPVKLPTSMEMVPVPTPGALSEWEGDEDESEIEIYSAVITAASCAQKMAEEEDQTILEACGPMDAAQSGFALFDPAEGELYLLDPGSFYQYELEAGFQGSMDITAAIVGQRGALAVLKPEDYTITNKPAAGAFKGCL